MSWSLVEPGEFRNRVGLASGSASISRAGSVLLCGEDLELVKIADRAVVLVDEAGMKLAFRAPRDGEASFSIAVSIARKSGRRDTGKRRLCISRALARLGVGGGVAAGIYGLVTKDDMLILPLVELAGDKAKDAAVAAGKPATKK